MTSLLGGPQGGGTSRTSLRRSFAWILGGNTVYNAVQWLLIIVLARLGSAEMVGEFALAQAITAPVFLAVGLNLRVVRATDVEGRWRPRQYMRLRWVLNALSVLLSLAAAVVFGVSQALLAVVAAVAVGKVSESTSHVLYGYFQLHDRLDLVSRSLLLRALLGSAGFIVTLIPTGELVLACLGMAAGWFLVYLVHDGPQQMRVRAAEPDVESHGRGGTTWELVRRAAPLGVDGGINSLTQNVPRYAVQIVLGTSALGAFAALAYLGRVVVMITGSLAESIIGRLARQVATGNTRAFRRLLRVLVLIGVGVSAAGLLGAWLLGEPVIGLLLGEDYVNQPVLLWLMLGAGVTTLQRSLGRALQAGHHFWQVLSVDAVTLAGAVAASVVLVPAYGLAGAGATLVVGFACGTSLSAVLLWRMLRALRVREEVKAG